METKSHQRLKRSILCGALCLASVARADSVEFNVSTLLSGRATHGTERSTPSFRSINRLVSRRRSSLYFDSINIVMSGWGSVQLDIGRDE